MSTPKDKIVFITGASSGIGEASARRFANAGAKLILAARRYDRLQKLADQLSTKCHLIELDVADKAAVDKAVADLPDEFKEVDILLNNAGKAVGLEKLYQGSVPDWEDMINTNVKGLLYVSRAVIPGMVNRGRGHIVNIGSIAGHEVYPNGAVYCATKHAVDAITKGLRLDVVDTPLRVSTVDPGLVHTEFSEVRFHGDKERAEKVYLGYKPLTADDIADTILWIVERPEHVQIAEVIILPTAQASAMVTHKTI